MTELWRGFANMAATAGREVVIAKGRGSTVWDDKGKVVPRFHRLPLVHERRLRPR